MVRRTRAEAKKHLEEAIPRIPTRYKEMTARADWKTPAVSPKAEENFKTAMSVVIAEELRRKGIEPVDNADWVRACDVKGSKVIGDRIRDALPKYDKKFGEPYETIVLPELERMPPREIDWEANVENRLKFTIRAWKKAVGK